VPGSGTGTSAHVVAPSAHPRPRGGQEAAAQSSPSRSWDGSASSLACPALSDSPGLGWGLRCCPSLPPGTGRKRPRDSTVVSSCHLWEKRSHMSDRLGGLVIIKYPNFGPPRLLAHRRRFSVFLEKKHGSFITGRPCCGLSVLTVGL